MTVDGSPLIDEGLQESVRRQLLHIAAELEICCDGPIVTSNKRLQQSVTKYALTYRIHSRHRDSVHTKHYLMWYTPSVLKTHGLPLANGFDVNFPCCHRGIMDT